MSRAYREWRAFLTKCMDDFVPGEIYHLLHTASLVGLFTCIFVRAPLRDRIRGLSAVEVKRGMGGLHGNKVSLRLLNLHYNTNFTGCLDCSLCFRRYFHVLH